MLRLPASASASPQLHKRVRFHERVRVKVIDLQALDNNEDVNDKDIFLSRGYYSARSFNIDERQTIIRDHSSSTGNIIQSSHHQYCYPRYHHQNSCGQNHARKRKSIRIPPGLLSLPFQQVEASQDRWHAHEDNNHRVAPTAPVRIGSTSDIVDNALECINLPTSMPRRQKQDTASRHNSKWTRDELVMHCQRQRWRNDFPPVAPLRKSLSNLSSTAININTT